MRKLLFSILPVVILAFSAGALTGCKNKWVKRAEEIEKAACACKDAKCAKEQRKKLNSYIKDTKGVKVKKKDAKRVGKLVHKARTCLQKVMLKERLESINKNKANKKK